MKSKFLKIEVKFRIKDDDIVRLSWSKQFEMSYEILFSFWKGTLEQ